MSSRIRIFPINNSKYQNIFIVFSLLIFIVISVNGQPLQYPPPTPLWTADSLGNRRAVVEVDTDADAAMAHIEWQRSDTLLHHNAIYAVDSTTNIRIHNIYRQNISADAGDIVFEPVSGPGIYYIYYMPYRLTGRRNYPTAKYPDFKNQSDPEWLDTWKGHPDIQKVSSVRIEAVDPFNAMSPMERPMSIREESRFFRKLEDKPYYLFPADRKYPYILKNQLPKILENSSSHSSFAGTARRGENYTFQTGLYLPARAPDSLRNVRVLFSDLKNESDHVISTEVMSCLNTGGITYDGHPFQKHLDVPPGNLQPLWILIDVPEETPPGVYRGRIQVQPENEQPQFIDVQLDVIGETAEDHGVNEPWLQTRLTWLNSTLYQDDTVILPYTPVKREDQTLSILGREVELDDYGFPAQIRSYFNSAVTRIGNQAMPLFSGPLRFSIEDASGEPVTLRTGSLDFIHKESGKISWTVTSQSTGIKIITEGSLEFDGFMNYAVKVVPEKPMKAKDIRMTFPFTRQSSRYMLGLGQKGGQRPEELSWKWNVKEKNQDGGWIGAVNGGLQFSLRDQHYVRPLNTNFYLQKPLLEPVSWANDGKGGIRIRPSGEVVCYSSEREMIPGDTLFFNFTLLITPFHTLNTDFQWSHRFYHAYQPIKSVRESGANLINIHHANFINPYINYPYIAWQEMKKYVDSAHAAGLQVKIYNTIRELSNRAYETFPMRSLGHEVYSAGDGGGASWLQEHIREDYIAAWFVPPLRDAAIINSGMNRWHNYYVEGMDWLTRNLGIDGIYLDDVAFDRITMKRIKRALTRDGHPGIIDLHSANQFNPRDGFNNSANLYMEHFPYLNRLWFGEYFDYEENGPGFYLTEVSGIPFGLMGEMLQDGGNPWRGMIYGMTNRMPWSHDADPRPVWKLWDEFGMEGMEMVGYWSDECPVRPDHPDVKATVYKKKGKAMIALASWAGDEIDVLLDIDWTDLGLDKNNVKTTVPFIRDFQIERMWKADDPLKIEPGKGLIIILQEH